MSTARVIAKHQTLAEKEMESWVCLLLLFYCTAVTVSQKCTQEGAVEVIGTVTPKLIAGRLEICYNGIWRAVYDREWSETEARIVCGVKGFPREGTFACENSCFGASSLPTGYENFRDCDLNVGLLACGKLEDQQRENDNAGIVCIQPSEVSSLLLPTQPNSTMTELQSTESSEGVSTISVVAIILGVVSAVLLLILLGVVMGWVWFCCRMKQRSKYTTRFSLPTSSIQTQPNECYEHNTSIPTQPNQCYEQTASTPLYDSVTTPKLIGAKESQ